MMELPTATFIEALAHDANLSPKAVQVLHSSGARSPEAVLSLLKAFPSLSTGKLFNASELSNRVLHLGGANVQTLLSAQHGILSLKRRGTPAGFGAVPPPQARWKKGDRVPVTPAPHSMGAAMAPAPVPLEGPAIDVRGCLPWPVRDQGDRGTCVAFAVTALREQLLCETQGGIVDLSEQFLYWAIKSTGIDSIPNQDGTWIEFALQALRTQGICTEAEWPYDPTAIPGNVSHGGQGAPSAPAIAQAASFACKPDVWRNTYGTTGHANAVLQELRSGRPVAVSLPVFHDALRADVNNWTTDVGWAFGHVIDPPETSVADGGHAVCVVGFEPDPSEPKGGYFTIRNSWSEEWGFDLPVTGYHGPEPGYGQISASYVDNFLWEYGQL